MKKQILRFDGKNVRTMSLPSRTDLAFGLCGSAETEQASDITIAVERIMTSNEGIAFKALSTLLLRAGLRVSDVLRVSGSDITNDGKVIIRQSKGSLSRIVQPVECLSFWLEFRSSSVSLSAIYSRYYVYRVFRKLLIMGSYGDNKRASVTHSGRHEVALSVYRVTGELESITNVLGHSSKKTASYYAQEKKK